MRARWLILLSATALVLSACGTDEDSNGELVVLQPGSETGTADTADTGDDAGSTPDPDAGPTDTRPSPDGRTDADGADTRRADTADAPADTGPPQDTGDGCPANAHRNSDGDCVCDDGYTVNDDRSACVPSKCPPHSHERDGSCYCDDGWVVNEDKSACVRECKQNTDCSGDLVCTNYECVKPPCTAGSCGQGLKCSSSGDCIVKVGSPPSGPPPSCNNVATWKCTGGNCGELIQFQPRKTNGWWDYPLNGETTSNQYRSWARRDLVKLIKYATSMTACQSKGWSFGNGGPLGLGDMSEKNGAIPGTSNGNPGHPQGTHTNGFDIDVAYYQTGTADNRLRPICKHTRGGQRVYHCVAAPTKLDVWRTALFLAHLHASPQVRVIGVDGKAGPSLEAAIQKLCQAGWVSTSACQNPKVAYEVKDTGRGWFRFHHHHLHLSLTTRSAAGFSNATTLPGDLPPRRCLTPECRPGPDAQADPRVDLYDGR